MSKSSVPFIIFHGDKDPLVPLQQSVELNDMLKKDGVDSTLHIVKGNGHGGIGFMCPRCCTRKRRFSTSI